MHARSVVVILGLCAALVSATQRSASLQPEVDADAEDAAFGAGSVRALLELHESAQANDAFQEHVDTLLLSLREQARARAAGDSADANAADVAAAADVEDAEAADDAESDAAAEGGHSVRVFGEAPAVAPITASAEAAEGTLRAEEWSAGPALLEADSDAGDELSAEADAELAAAADVADAEDAEGAEEEDVRVFGEAPAPRPITATAEAAEGTLAAEEWSAGPALLELNGADADADTESDTDSDSDEEAEAAEDAESDESEDGMAVEMEADATERSAIVEALPSAESLAAEQWTEGAALLELDAEEDEEDEEEEDAEDSAEEEDAAFVQTQVQGDWKDPPVWWKAPEEEMANADQQPWPLDPNFPMSVLDPPPNLPLANIEDANNYPPMADPQMAFNIDPSAFPQTNDKVGTDDPSFASFSINGR